VGLPVTISSNTGSAWITFSLLMAAGFCNITAAWVLRRHTRRRTSASARPRRRSDNAAPPGLQQDPPRAFWRGPWARPLPSVPYITDPGRPSLSFPVTGQHLPHSGFPLRYLTRSYRTPSPLPAPPPVLRSTRL
jgi:hypothetical protein